MALPKIEAYPMPRAEDLPRNVARWRIDPRRAVLLIHDMQRYFIGAFPAGRQPVVDLVRNVDRLRKRAAAAGIPVTYTAQPGSMAHHDRGLLKDFWGAGMSARPEERDVIDELTPEPEDHLFVKWRYTAFHRNGLLEFMREQGRDQIVISGVYAHVGCLMTACDAFTHNIQPFLVADALADFSEAQHHAALAYGAELCAVTLTTDAALAAMAAMADQRVTT